MTRPKSLRTETGRVSDDTPWKLLSNWMSAAAFSEPNDPDGAALATANADGALSLRMVLVRHVGKEGACFYTNEISRKGRDLSENPKAALLWHWKSLRLQVRMEGSVNEMEATLVDDYFKNRPRGSQISAWASLQSQEMAEVDDFDQRLSGETARFSGEEVPRPPWWRGYVLEPSTVEFWQDGAMRRHDRLVFKREGKEWQKAWLYP